MAWAENGMKKKKSPPIASATAWILFLYMFENKEENLTRVNLEETSVGAPLTIPYFIVV